MDHLTCHRICLCVFSSVTFLLYSFFQQTESLILLLCLIRKQELKLWKTLVFRNHHVPL